MKNSPETLKKRNEKRRKLMRESKRDFPMYKNRICKLCWENKPCKWASCFLTSGEPAYKTRCDKCHNEYKRSVMKRPKSKEMNNARVRKYQRENKLKAVKYKGDKCEYCWYNKSIAALSFHHINPEEKEYYPWQILDWWWDKVKKELDKCIMLCANCHMEEHERLRNLSYNN